MKEKSSHNWNNTCLEGSSSKPIEALSTTDRLIIHNYFLHIYLLLFSFRSFCESEANNRFHFGSKSFFLMPLELFWVLFEMLPFLAVKKISVYYMAPNV